MRCFSSEYNLNLMVYFLIHKCFQKKKKTHLDFKWISVKLYHPLLFVLVCVFFLIIYSSSFFKYLILPFSLNWNCRSQRIDRKQIRREIGTGLGNCVSVCICMYCMWLTNDWLSNYLSQPCLEILHLWIILVQYQLGIC